MNATFTLAAIALAILVIAAVSMFAQILVGGLIGAGVVLGVYFALKGLFSKR